MKTTIKALMTQLGYKHVPSQLDWWKREKGWELPSLNEEVEAAPLVERLCSLLAQLRKNDVTVRALEILAKLRAEFTSKPAKAEIVPAAKPIESLAWERLVCDFKNTRPLIGSLLERGVFLGATANEITLGFAAGSLEAESMQDPNKKTSAEAFISNAVGRIISLCIRSLTTSEIQKVNPATPVLDQPPTQKETKDTPEQIFSELFEGHKIRAVKGEIPLVSILDSLAALGYLKPREAWADIKERAPEIVAEIATYSFGPGQPTPVSNLKTLLKVLGVASNPPDKTKLVRFREWSARTLERVITGDRTLAGEIEERAQRKENKGSVLQLPVEERARLSRLYERIADRMEGEVPKASIDSLLIRAAEVAEGRLLTSIKPKAEEGRWFTPTDIAGYYGCRVYDVAMAIKNLRLKGDDERGIPGLSEPYRGTTEDGKRDIVMFRYTKDGAIKIKQELERMGIPRAKVGA